MTPAILLKTRKMVEGSYKQHAWTDDWEDQIEIRYDGELTPEVCDRIVAAYTLDQARRLAARRGSYQASLRTPQPDKVIGVDVPTRTLRIACSCMLAD